MPEQPVNNKYWLHCRQCCTDLEDNESYDFRVKLYKTYKRYFNHIVWAFIDNWVDLSGMTCQCETSEHWTATFIHNDLLNGDIE